MHHPGQPDMVPSMYRLIEQRSSILVLLRCAVQLRLIVLTALVTACVLPFTTSCGRKTDPRPPELVAPEVIAELAAENDVKGIRISWERPTHYVDGSRMLDLAGFQVERSSGDDEFAVVTTLWVEDRDRFRQIRSFHYLDGSVSPGQTYRYRIVSFTTDNYFSEPSAVVQLLREPPPAAGS
jgi:hypothetical protein